MTLLLPKRVVIRSPAHLDRIRTLRCCLAGCKGGAIQAHHVRLAAFGAGMGVKPGDCCCVPLCVAHHAENHRIGHNRFEWRYGIDLAAIAARLWAESQEGEMP